MILLHAAQLSRGRCCSGGKASSSSCSMTWHCNRNRINLVVATIVVTFCCSLRSDRLLVKHRQCRRLAAVRTAASCHHLPCCPACATPTCYQTGEQTNEHKMTTNCHAIVTPSFQAKYNAMTGLLARAVSAYERDSSATQMSLSEARSGRQTC